MSAGDLDDTQEEEQVPEKQSLCQSLKRSCHLKCLILTLLILACLGVLTWCQIAEVTRVVVNYQSFPITTRRRTSPCDEGYVYIPVAFLVMFYLVYLVECWHCSTRLQLTYKVDVSAVYEYVRKLREADPLIWWKAVCYHYIRRTRQITRYRNGDSYTTTQIYYERVNSHSSGSCFSYSHCGVKDISKKLAGLEDQATTKIRFSKGFAFANIEAANEFEEQRTRFFQENERLDDYVEMREGLDMSGVCFQESMVAYAPQLPWYSSPFAFWILSILLFSWPLRVLIEFKTAYVHYQVTKLFGVNGPNALSSTGRISRGSTVDSTEIEHNICTNVTLAPTYSEALLMELSGRLLCTDSNGNIQNGVCNGIPQHGNMYTSSARSSWRRLSLPRPTFPVSFSRTSLRSAHAQSNPLDSPPDYEEALWHCRPVNNMPLRRSVTDRNIVGMPFRTLDEILTVETSL